MPKVNLTMDQWRLLLKAVRHCKEHAKKYLMFSQADHDGFSIIEGRVIDMAFELVDLEENKLDMKFRLMNLGAVMIKAEQSAGKEWSSLS